MNKISEERNRNVSLVVTSLYENDPIYWSKRKVLQDLKFEVGVIYRKIKLKYTRENHIFCEKIDQKEMDDTRTIRSNII